MEKFQRILICSDNPEDEANIFNYAKTIVQLFRTEEIHIIHVIPPENSSLFPYFVGASGFEVGMQPEMHKQYTAYVQDKQNRLDQAKETYFSSHDSNLLYCETLTGTPLYEILRYGMEKEIDLIIVGRSLGRKNERDKTAILATRITRKATCSVLTLPIDCEPTFENILVPVRNSSCSANALDTACVIATATKGQVIPLNMYQVHGGYSNIGTTLEDHDAILKEYAYKECDELKKQMPDQTSITTSLCVPDLYNKPSSIAMETAKKIPADVIVIGARGRRGMAGILLGAVTEKLIRKSHIPILAVKKKGETVSVLKALLDL